jgi:hypothetical protein
MQQADGSSGLEVLRRAAQNAEASKARAQANLALAEQHPERYAALCDAAEAAADAANQAYREAARTSRAAAMSHNALDDWDSLTVDEFRMLVRCTWPVIWVRTAESLDAAGCVARTRCLEDRVWFIPEGEQHRFELPQKGRGYVREAHEPVPWPDGSPTLTAEERRSLRKSARRVAPETYVTAGATAEDLERWQTARAHFLAHGRTDDEVLGEWREHGYRAAARELGMSASHVRHRVKRIRVARGELEDGTVVERLRRSQYAPRAVPDEHVLAAFELHAGDIGAVGRELGMPLATVRYRLLRGRAAKGDAAAQRELEAERARKLVYTRAARARRKAAPG